MSNMFSKSTAMNYEQFGEKEKFCERNTCQSEEPEASVSLPVKLKHSIKTIFNTRTDTAVTVKLCAAQIKNMN